MRKKNSKGKAKRSHVEIAEGLQDSVLLEFEKKLENGSMTSTDLRTLASILIANGWTFDPARVSRPLSDLVKPTALPFEDEELPEPDEDLPVPSRPLPTRPLGFGSGHVEE